ncbi:hypothetical protein [uncultured Marinobacter sp.]|uniref:hypothetical protein n=1 Tax=uncultured Marinobacter sp. TaxID=187379 RepID=UPI00259AAEC4|nr:hypothetical protein [uncultured Marinobacter sp.]
MAVGFFLEKQLASLRHLFPAKNPTATPRRRALAGFRLIRAAVRFALRAGSDQFDATFNGASGYSRCFLLFVFSIPVLPVGRGVWGIFLAGKKMSERSELFFPEEKYPTPRVPAPTTGRLGAQTSGPQAQTGPIGKPRIQTRFC